MKNSDQLDICCVFQFNMSYRCYPCPSVEAEQKDLIAHSIEAHQHKEKENTNLLHYQILPSQHVSNNLSSSTFKTKMKVPSRKELNTRHHKKCAQQTTWN